MDSNNLHILQLNHKDEEKIRDEYTWHKTIDRATLRWPTDGAQVVKHRTCLCYRICNKHLPSSHHPIFFCLVSHSTSNHIQRLMLQSVPYRMCNVVLSVKHKQLILTSLPINCSWCNPQTGLSFGLEFGDLIKRKMGWIGESIESVKSMKIRDSLFQFITLGLSPSLVPSICCIYYIEAWC